MNEHLDANPARLTTDEKELESVLRPASFNDFAGQGKVVENLSIFVQAARQRGDALDTCCYMVLRDWEKPRFRILLPMNFRSI